MKMIYFDFFDVLSSPAYMQVIEKYLPKNEQGEWERMLDLLDLGELHEDELVRRLSRRTALPEFQIWEEIESGPQLNKRLLDLIRDELKPHYKIGLLTNAPRSLIERMLEDFLPLFDTVVISSDLGIIKPDPRIFEAAIKLSGFKPEEILFTDDKEKNIEAAKKSGMDGIVFTGVAQFKDELQKHLA